MSFQNNSLLLLISMLFLAPFSSSKLNGFQAKLKHIDADGHYSQEELVRRGFHQSKRRLEAIKARLTNCTTNYGTYVVNAPNIGGYTTELFIGTPPVAINPLIDTGSNLIWTQCAPCTDCLPEKNMYDPSASPSYSNVLCKDPRCSKSLEKTLVCNAPFCQYNYSYNTGDNFIFGNLSTETFTFADISDPSNPQPVPVTLTFGCTEINYNENIDGIVGLSPGHFSLVSQFDTPMFSYCLDSNVNEFSVMVFGPMAYLNMAGFQSTPFVNTGSDYPIFYFLNLTGISLGSTLLSIPPSVFQFVGGQISGTLIDSGTTFTQLAPQAYAVVNSTIVNKANKPWVSYPSDPTDFPVCFDGSSGYPANLPLLMTLHFDGANMDVPFMVYMPDANLYCFAMSPCPADSPLTILGNYQHSNMLVVYDLAAQKLSFVPATCKDL